MKFKITALLAAVSIILASCSDDKENAPKTPSVNKPMAKTASMRVQTQGKLVVSISDLKASGDDCNVRMAIYNGSRSKIQTFQMRKIQVSTSAGEVIVEHSNNYPVDIGKTYTRGGIMVYGTSCKAITQIHVTETLCRYKVPMSEYERSSCLADVVYQSTRKVRFTQLIK